MNKLSISLMTACALLLSACGGGGSSDDMDSDTGSDIGGNNGSISHAPIQGVMNSANTVAAVGSDNLNVLNVNNHAVPLTIPGFSAGELTNMVNSSVNGKIYDHFIVSGSHYADSKFGYIVDEATGNRGVAFSQGKLTQDMPTQGNAAYKGSSVYVDSNGNSATGEAALSVDFAAKTVTGALTGETYAPVNFSGTLSGNRFREDAASHTAVTGHFYGVQAAEVGGVFKAKDGSYQGSFGALKQ